MFPPGSKVRIKSHPDWGFGEVKGAVEGGAQVAFARSLHEWHMQVFPNMDLVHEPLPTETRCFVITPEAVRYGRVLSMRNGHSSLRSYYVRWGGADPHVELQENEFSVRSYLEFEDARGTLAVLAQETPFFFQARQDLLIQLLKQNSLAGGLTGIASSKIDMLTHQVEVASRVLRDPIIRYRQVTNRALRQSNTETGPPSAALYEDTDPEAPEMWDAESAQLDQAGGNRMGVRPDEALFLKDNWKTFQQFVRERSFADKELIIAIADKIRSENLWQPALLADALHRPIQQINKAKTRLQSVLANMRTDAFIETLPEEEQGLVKFLRDSVTSGRSLPAAIADYAQVNGVSEEAVGAALNDISQRKCNWSRRTHDRKIPLEVLGN